MMKKSVSIKVLLLVFTLLLSTFSIAIVGATDDSWTTLTPIPTARTGLGVAVVDGKIYAIGGNNGSLLGTNEMYDPETDTWTTGTPIPTPRWGLGVAVVDDLLYAIGGKDAENYRNENEQYTQADYIPEFPHGPFCHCSLS